MFFHIHSLIENCMTNKPISKKVNDVGSKLFKILTQLKPIKSTTYNLNNTLSTKAKLFRISKTGCHEYPKFDCKRLKVCNILSKSVPSYGH